MPGLLWHFGDEWKLNRGLDHWWWMAVLMWLTMQGTCFPPSLKSAADTMDKLTAANGSLSSVTVLFALFAVASASKTIQFPVQSKQHRTRRALLAGKGVTVGISNEWLHSRNKRHSTALAKQWTTAMVPLLHSTCLYPTCNRWQWLGTLNGGCNLKTFDYEYNLGIVVVLHWICFVSAMYLYFTVHKQICICCGLQLSGRAGGGKLEQEDTCKGSTLDTMGNCPATP